MRSFGGSFDATAMCLCPRATAKARLETPIGIVQWTVDASQRLVVRHDVPTGGEGTLQHKPLLEIGHSDFMIDAHICD